MASFTISGLCTNTSRICCSFISSCFSCGIGSHRQPPYTWKFSGSLASRGDFLTTRRICPSIRFDLFLTTRTSTTLSGIAPHEMSTFFPDVSRPRPIPQRINFSTRIFSNVVHFMSSLSQFPSIIKLKSHYFLSTTQSDSPILYPGPSGFGWVRSSDTTLFVL